jgi:hypothetical protein
MTSHSPTYTGSICGISSRLVGRYATAPIYIYLLFACKGKVFLFQDLLQINGIMNLQFIYIYIQPHF